jgi:hypothetical protein
MIVYEPYGVEPGNGVGGKKRVKIALPLIKADRIPHRFIPACKIPAIVILQDIESRLAAAYELSIGAVAYSVMFAEVPEEDLVV